MAKNVEKKIEVRTLETVRTELNKLVDEYNLSDDSEVRVELELQHKKLVDEYNELSLLTAYAGFMDDELPLVALGKAYTYATVSTKDSKHSEVINGVKRSISTRSVKDGVRMLSISKFLTWAMEKNHQLAADKLWIGKYAAAREEINRQWKRYWDSNGETAKFEIGKMKYALQAMFDSLVFVAGASGKNGMVANGRMARYALGVSNERKVDLEKKKQTVVNMNGNLWEQVSMDIWHMVCTAKDYKVLIGDEKDTDEEETEEKKEETAK